MLWTSDTFDISAALSMNGLCNYILGRFSNLNNVLIWLTHFCCAAMFLNCCTCGVYIQTSEEISQFEGVDFTVPTVPEIEEVEHLTCVWIIKKNKYNLSATWENIPADMCAKRRLKSACASAQFDQSLRCPREGTLHHCTQWRSSLGTHVQKYVSWHCGLIS